MAQDIRVCLVGQWASAFSLPDVFTDFFGFLRMEDFLKIVVKIPDVSHVLLKSQHTAGPNIAIRIHLDIGDSSITRNNLAIFFKDLDGYVIISQAQ